MNLLRRYLQLPVIIGPLPNQIVAGDLVSALPVMQNFNWIVDQVNANVTSSLPANQSSIATYVAAADVGGTGNVITLTPTPSISAYAAGQGFRFPASAPNTGAVTVNVSGLGPKALVNADATALSGRELLAGGLYDILYNGTSFMLMNASQGSNIITWTPAINFGGGTTGITYGTQQGKAWKWGRVLYFSFLIVLTNKGSSTGGITITGLPFTVNSGWAGNSPCQLYIENVTFASGYVISFYNLGTTTLGMANITSGSAAASMTDTAFANNSAIAANGFYVV